MNKSEKNLGIIGAGGQVSLGVLRQSANLAKKTGEKIILLIDSQKALIKPEGIPTDIIREIIEPGYADDAAKKASRTNVKDYMNSEGANAYSNLPDLLEDIQVSGVRLSLVDVSGMNKRGFDVHFKSQELGMGMSTANKNPGAFSSLEEYQEMNRIPHGRYNDETACMAGAGALGYIEGRAIAGDHVERIEGSYSGTLTFIFSTLEEEIRKEIESNGKHKAKPFSQIVDEARIAGFTEPHPADDLNLMDMAKKMELHNKKLGRDVGVDNVEINGFIPDKINNIKDVSEYITALKQVDQTMYDRMKESLSEGKTLRVVGVINKQGDTKVELRELGLSHPVAQLKEALNGTLIRSRDRGEWSLTAPGAGIDATATSVRQHALQLVLSTYNPRNEKMFPVGCPDGLAPGDKN